MAGMAEIFKYVGGDATPKEVSNTAYDEIILMLGLLPMAFTNVRAPISSTLSATDASPTGAGSCVATVLKRPYGMKTLKNASAALFFWIRSETMKTSASGKKKIEVYGNLVI